MDNEKKKKNVWMIGQKKKNVWMIGQKKKKKDMYQPLNTSPAHHNTTHLKPSSQGRKEGSFLDLPSFLFSIVEWMDQSNQCTTIHPSIYQRTPPFYPSIHPSIHPHRAQRIQLLPISEAEEYLPMQWTPFAILEIFSGDPILLR